MTAQEALTLIELGAAEVAALTPGTQAADIASVSARLLTVLMSQITTYATMTSQPIETVLTQLTFENPDPTTR